MTDYKDTLNLPNTDFAMKANLPSKEPKMIEFWEQMDLRSKVAQARQGREKFILHDGPPYANGEIHTGHAAQKVLKDILLPQTYKFSSAHDYKVFYRQVDFLCELFSQKGKCFRLKERA